MRSDTRVSVIIPTYNHARFISSAIDSVLEQTYKNVEIIVVDDGSTDNTKQILEPYIEANKILYYYQTNKGAPAARNYGIKIAKGKFIKFLGSDDFLYSQQLELQVADLEKRQSAISITDYELLYESGYRKVIRIRIPSGNLLATLITRSLGPEHAFLVSRDDVLRVGGI